MKYRFILLSVFFSSCVFFKNDNDTPYPKESKLTFDVFKISERFIEDQNYYILQLNHRRNTEYYEPYILFYNKNDLRLEFSVYNPGKVISIKDSVVLGYYNGNRSKSKKIKLENGYNFLFEKQEPGSSQNITHGDISSFEIKKDTLIFKLFDSHNQKNVKYQVSQIVFSPFRENNIEIYDIYDGKLIYNIYSVDELALKRSLWRNYIEKTPRKYSIRR